MPTLSNKRLPIQDSSVEIELIVDGGILSAVGSVLPAQPRSFNKNTRHSLPYCKRSEAVIGMVMAFAGHLAWLAISPASRQAPEVTPPKPIMVEWLAAAQPRAETPKPSPPKVREAKKTVIKAKPKVRKQAAIKPRPIRSTARPVSANTVTQTQDTHKAELLNAPVAERTAPAPAATVAPDDARPKDMLISLPNLNADYLHNPAPAYPALSREQGEQGKVLLRAMINADGSVARLELRKTSGFERLDKAALETVRQWRFVPARRGGLVVPAWVVVPVSFTLEG